MASSTSTPRRHGRRRSPMRRRSPSSARATSGLVWFTGHDQRLTVEELEELHPGLVAAVAAHPGVAMLLVRSKAFGAVVFGPKGTRFLDEDRVEGEDPTTLFGPHTIMSLKREDAMVHAPGPAAPQPVRPGARRGRRVRGADRVARGPRRTADRAVHPPSGRVDARRGGPARGAGHLPQHPHAGSDRSGSPSDRNLRPRRRRPGERGSHDAVGRPALTG